VIIAKQRISGCTLTLRMHPEMRWGERAYATVAQGPGYRSARTPLPASWSLIISMSALTISGARSSQ
jgi:hypothetical protein